MKKLHSSNLQFIESNFFGNECGVCWYSFWYAYDNSFLLGGLIVRFLENKQDEEGTLGVGRSSSLRCLTQIVGLRVISGDRKDYVSYLE
jgi:hypothetical protein